MKTIKLACGFAVVVLCVGFSWADQPALVLVDGGIQFPDGTVQETSAVVADGPPTLTIAVDCAAGGSINEALKQPADELTVEISGFCDEIVDLSRSNVTLRGSDPLTDGIHASASLPYNSAILVRGVAGGVALENLSLTGAMAGFSINDSFGVHLTNCRLENSSYTGGFVSSAQVNMTDTVVSGNGNTGIRVGGGSHLGSTGCTIEANGTDGLGTGIRVGRGSELFLTDSAVEGKRAILVEFGSRVYGKGAPTVIEGLPDAGGFGLAVAVDSTSSLELSGVSIVGPFSVRWKSCLKLNDTTQTIPPGLTSVNSVSGGSTLLVSGSTTLVGDVNINEFGTGVFSSGSGVSGNLSCGSGGDAYCENPSVVTGTSSCEKCTTP